MIINAEQHWVCPNCPASAVTVGQPNRFHDCAALGGFTTPMVLEGVDCKVVALEREDYLSGEDVRWANGRPVSSVRVERADGSNDCFVYAPTAKAVGEN